MRKSVLKIKQQYTKGNEIKENSLSKMRNQLAFQVEHNKLHINVKNLA